MVMETSVSSAFKGGQARPAQATLSPQVSVVFVNYNTGEHLLRALQSFCESVRQVSYELIVVDNGSRDESAEMVRRQFPWVKVIANPENRFYAAAANQGLEASKGKAVLYFNTDAVMVPETLERMFAVLNSQSDIAAVGCRFISPQGKVEPCVRAELKPLTYLLNFTVLGKLFSGFRKSHNARQEYQGWDRSSTRDVETCADICLLVRRQALAQTGGYDEGFKLYFCEDDLCCKLRGLGHRIVFVGEVSIVHFGHASVAQEKPEWVRKLWRADALCYARRNFNGIAVFGIWVLMALTEALRGFQALCAKLFGTPAPKGWWES